MALLTGFFLIVLMSSSLSQASDDPPPASAAISSQIATRYGAIFRGHLVFGHEVSLDGRTYVGCAREGWASVSRDREPRRMTMHMLENAEYRTEFSPGGRVRLVDGVHREEIVAGAAAELIVSLGKAAIGDLDGDGFEDAAVILVTHAGGSGTFRHLAAVLNRNGTPEHVAALFLGDRIKVNSLFIRSGKIEAEMLIHDSDDPMPQPTLKMVQKYELRNDTLVPVSLP